MGCNVSKDVKVEDQGNADNAVNGGDKNAPEMSEEKAAEKIQASFRGYKTRKTLKNNGVLPAKGDAKQSIGEVDEKTEEQPENPEQKNAAKPGSARYIDPSEIADIDLNDAELEKAAAKIQASYRNFTAKKKQVETATPTPPETIKEKEEHGNDAKNEEENLEDIDLEDPAVEKAALKIQSTFRGYKVRKEVTTETPMTNGEKGADE